MGAIDKMTKRLIFKEKDVEMLKADMQRAKDIYPFAKVSGKIINNEIKMIVEYENIER